MLNRSIDSEIINMANNHVQAIKLQDKGQVEKPFRSLVGKSPAMLKIHHDIIQVANSDANVLILGESGTGKEVVARNVHYHSERRDNPFVPINCGAIPHDLLESELFGHEKGAFTGAITSKQGRFSMAEGGTLFLDEIGEMTMSMQVKLLRVLEERAYERVGGTTTLNADIRIIAATNRNLEDMVQQGKFREDLFYRLDVFPILLPALCERKEDIPLLIKEIISRLEQSKRNTVRFTPDAITSLLQYDWPGNVRELANHIERLTIQYPNGLIQANNLPDRIKSQASLYSASNDDLSSIDTLIDADHLNSPETFSPQINFPMDGLDLKSYISNIEIDIIQKALECSDGIIAHAAKSLGLRRTTLAEKMRKYSIHRNINSLDLPDLREVAN